MEEELHLETLLRLMPEHKASDLHVSAGSAPRIRIDGLLQPLTSYPILNSKTALKLCLEQMPAKLKPKFESHGEIDFSFGIEGCARFRANVYHEKESAAGAFRILPWQIPTPQELSLASQVQNLVHKKRGLVLVTGATGSGKSTTIASLLNEINQTRQEHIMTVEDPIEFVYEHGQCMVHQREVGQHTESFSTALKYILRQDPDVVLIGEMRDLETIQAAITTAETGHLVFATLHTNTAVQTIDRIIDVFPAIQQPQVRSQLSFILEAVLSQQLIPLDKGGRRLAQERLFPNYAIRNLIREGKTHQIYSQLQTGQDQTGMKTMNQCLIDLCQSGELKIETARSYSPAIQEFDQLTSQPRPR